MLILVIEDEVLIAMSLEDALRDAGHDVLGPVATVPAALECAGDRRPDLALANIDLRDAAGDGIDAARELLRRHGVPTMFVSGSLIEARGAKDAALGFLRKPYDSNQVVASVEVAKALIEGREPDGLPYGLELFESPSSEDARSR